MLNKIHMFLSIIIAIILVVLVFGIIITLLDKEPTNISSNLPILTQKEEKEVEQVIEIRSAATPSIPIMVE